jgi:hypothetical protein
MVPILVSILGESASDLPGCSSPQRRLQYYLKLSNELIYRASSFHIFYCVQVELLVWCALDASRVVYMVLLFLTRPAQ